MVVLRCWRFHFELIQFDEGHHNVAATWVTLKAKFPNARIVNYSATPLRADGQQMAGRIIYSYPVYRAIREGYVKRLKAVSVVPNSAFSPGFLGSTCNHL